MNPPLTWAVHGDVLKFWRGREFMGEVSREHFPALIVTMAHVLRDPVKQDDPDVPLG